MRDDSFHFTRKMDTQSTCTCTATSKQQGRKQVNLHCTQCCVLNGTIFIHNTLFSRPRRSVELTLEEFNSSTDTAAIRALAFCHPPFLRWNAHKITKKKRRSRYRFKPAVSPCTDRMSVTSWYFSSRSWVSEPCFLFEMLLFISCCRYSSYVRARRTCVCVCTNARRVGDILSFNFSLSSVALRAATKTRRDPSKGRGVAGEMGSRERRRWEAGCWGADTAELCCGPDFIYETRARMDHRPAGRPICCSCPGNTQQWSMGIYRHQLNLSPLLPPPLWFLTLPLTQALFILHFLFSFRSWTKPDYWHAVDVTVPIATEALRQVCGVTVRSGEKVTVGHRCSANTLLFKGSTLLPTLSMQTVWGLTKNI